MNLISPILSDESILFRNDQIFTVLAVLGIIFAGIAVYLLIMERKVRKLEKIAKELRERNNEQRQGTKDQAKENREGK